MDTLVSFDISDSLLLQCLELTANGGTPLRDGGGTLANQSHRCTQLLQPCGLGLLL
jgi:hypothetical protein